MIKQYVIVSFSGGTDKNLGELKMAGGTQEEGIMFASESDAARYIEDNLSYGAYFVLPVYIKPLTTL
jgi:hypothetical protein